MTTLEALKIAEVALIHSEPKMKHYPEAAQRHLDALVMVREEISKLSSNGQFPGFPTDEGGSSALTRLEAEVACNEHKSGYEQVKDSSLMHGDLRHILRAVHSK